MQAVLHSQRVIGSGKEFAVMSESEVASILLQIAKKTKGNLSAKAFEGAKSDAARAQSVLNEIAVPVLKLRGKIELPETIFESLIDFAQAHTPAPSGTSSEPNDGGNRTAVIPAVRCRPDELTRLKAEAEEAGLSLSDHIRKKLFG